MGVDNRRTTKVQICWLSVVDSGLLGNGCEADGQKRLLRVLFSTQARGVACSLCPLKGQNPEGTVHPDQFADTHAAGLRSETLMATLAHDHLSGEKP